MTTDIEALLGAQPPPFALLYRPTVTGTDRLDLLVGTVSTVDTLADLPLPPVAGDAAAGGRHDVLALVPYRQLAERGFACHDDGTPLLALRVDHQHALDRAEFARSVPDVPIELRDGHFDVDDDAYADLVRAVVAEEIGRGEGANFVIRRSFVADVADWSVATALAFFNRLVSGEPGAYWTFVVHTGDRTLVGATPERHVSLAGGTVTMNPISGTYRYPASGPTVDGVLRFLADRKETDELYMVVDEELKMMGRFCDQGARMVGPFLKEMGRLAHTEYHLEGRTSRDVREILRETMFAPTVTGSPLESACRAITRHEPGGRGYYAGVLALIGQDAGGRTLDAAIAIRTADVDRSGRLAIGVGATLVRHSDARSEVAETRAKAGGLLAALGAAPGGGADTPHSDGARPRLGEHPAVRQALAARNTGLSRFWLRPATGRGRLSRPELAGRRVLVVDAEDTFTAMLGHQLRALGPAVTIRRFDEVYDVEDYDVVLVGPGPGDPRDTAHPKIAELHATTQRLLKEGIPIVSVCLGHQVLALQLGLELRRLPRPNQGLRREIDLFGRRQRVGFYNTFAAWHIGEEFHSAAVSAPVRVSRDPRTGEVYALSGPGLRSMQFHPESVLTTDGPGILAEVLGSLLPARTVAA